MLQEKQREVDLLALIIEVAARIMQSSSKELNTLVADRV